MKFELESIGIIATPFREKFGAPRQPMLATEARGIVRFNKNIPIDTVKDLEKFSHIWLIYPFHKNSGPWHPLIETPRVEAKKVGVFATRAPKRPNSLGMSAVKLDRVEIIANEIILHVSGVDILDGTPIFDIKPYLPYSDSIIDANSGWITKDIVRYPVEFSDESQKQIQDASSRHPRLENLITQVLELDPRPTSQRRESPIEDVETENKKFAFRILDLDVHWHVQNQRLCVEKVIQEAQP